MANVTITVYRREKLIDGMLQGAPYRKLIVAAPAAWTGDSAPQMTLPDGGFVLLIITDAPIEFAMVRANATRASETSVPIPCLEGGLSSYLTITEDYDNKFFMQELV